MDLPTPPNKNMSDPPSPIARIQIQSPFSQTEDGPAYPLPLNLKYAETPPPKLKYVDP